MKLKQKKRTNFTLSDKIAEALTVKPKADIEDDHIFGTKPLTVSRGDLSSSESENEAIISDFRKRNTNLLSDVNKKYEGEVVSRRDIKSNSDDSESEDNLNSNDCLTKNDRGSGFDSDIFSKLQKQIQAESDESDDGNESEDYSITKLHNLSNSNQDSDSEDSADEENTDMDGDDDEVEGYDISQLEEPMKEEFEHVKKQNISEEAKKGASVKNQLLLWEGLLEMRIHLQRCMTSANQMPLPDSYEKLKENETFVEEAKNSKAQVVNVLDKLLELQNILLHKNPETKNLTAKKVENSTNSSLKKYESDEEIPSDTDNEEIPSDTEDEDAVDDKKPKIIAKPQTNKKRKLEDYEKEIAMTHKAFKTFRDSTIQKWNDKVRISTAANIKSQPTNTILQQISYILSDKQKLVRRTQLKRSEFDIIGYHKEPKCVDVETNDEINTTVKDRKEMDEYIPEIFDDSDFYHQLLRELIECKSADISDPVQLSRQWIALQQMRSKMKRKVDTKATKGRKIKYVVHNQLVNYMAPEKSTSWTDESTNELYSSLFGKVFERNNVGIDACIENGKIIE